MQPVEVRRRMAPGMHAVSVVNPSVPKAVNIFNTSALFRQRSQAVLLGALRTAEVEDSKGAVIRHRDEGAGWLAYQSGARSALIRAVAARLPTRRQACW
jgi:hypothetical protein